MIVGLIIGLLVGGFLMFMLVVLTEAADAIEIWVIYNDEPTCLYLFPYDMGIVQVGE